MGTISSKDKTKFHKDNMTNKTGFIGVTYKARDGVYQARIRVPWQKEKIYCGSSKSAEVAARLYDKKAVELFGIDAVTNFSN